MAKVVWLGSPGDGEENEWRGIHFVRGEAVDIKDEEMIDALKKNRFFTVDGKSDAPESKDVAKAAKEAEGEEARRAAAEEKAAKDAEKHRLAERDKRQVEQQKTLKAS